MASFDCRRYATAVAVGFCLLSTSVNVTSANEDLELIEPGKLIVGYAPEAGSFDLVDGKLDGVFALIMDEAAKRLGLEMVAQPFAFPALIPALQAGRIDTAGGFSVTQPRAQIMYYTTPQFFQPEVMAVRQGFALSSWEEAAERKLKLASNAGFFQIGAWEKMGIDVKTFDTPDACLLDVLHEGSDGCAVGAYNLIYKQATQPDSPISKLTIVPMSGPQILADVNSFGVNKNNPNLARALSKVLVDLWRDGTIEKVYAQVFKQAPYDNFLQAPVGGGIYLPGPWEEGVTPPVSDSYSTVTTVAPGTLTVGVATSSGLLGLEGTTMKGAEADMLEFTAGKLGLKLAAVAVDDPEAALNEGKVDLVAGGLVQTAGKDLWYTMPVAFSPDYIYVKPAKDGSLPSFTKWEDVKAAGGKLAVTAGNPRIAQIKAVGVETVEVPDGVAGLKAVNDGAALGFVGTTLEYASSIAADPSLADIGFGWVRNNNNQTAGKAYSWAVRKGNAALADAIDQAVSAAWQERVITKAMTRAFPGANTTALLAPGPTAIGTSYDSSKDFTFMSTWISGPWMQRPTR